MSFLGGIIFLVFLLFTAEGVPSNNVNLFPYNNTQNHKE